MTRIRYILALAVMSGFLAGCGIDGPPHRPAEVTEPGISLSGDARIGVKYDSNL